MTPEQRAEIESLAAVAHEKSKIYLGLGMCNQPTDPDEARAATIRYRVAETEWRVAEAALIRAQEKIVFGQ